jgi:phosphate transport system permease protein
MATTTQPAPPATDRPVEFNERVGARRRTGLVVSTLLFVATLFGIVVLVTLLVDVVVTGAAWLDAGFLTSYPSRFPAEAGIKSAIVGSLWMVGLTALLAVPIGVASAVYLEEYAPRHWFFRFVQINIANLAGVPSVLYGILGLALFVRLFALGQSLMAGSMTMALLILPVVIIGTQEALRAVPQGVRESAYALGATRWQVIWSHLLPIAAPGILTGVILSLSRAIGETAPLIMIGALTFVAFLPESVMDAFTVLPIQIFNWTSRPQAEFQELAAAGIIVLMVLLLTMNLSAILLRNRFERYRAQ